MIRARHAGDYGDAIASLLPFREAGGGSYFLVPHPFGQGKPREPMTGARANFLLPLLQCQPYIQEAAYVSCAGAVNHDYCSIRFTTSKEPPTETLAHWHARHVGITLTDLSPWLNVEPNPKYAGRVVVARSLRYNNPAFPWAQLLRKHVDKTVFVGNRPERHKMLNMCKGRLDYAKVNNALEMAQVIKAASLFIGNQSFPCWLAMALGVPVIQETFLGAPDSMIKRDNAQFIMSPRHNAEFYASL